PQDVMGVFGRRAGVGAMVLAKTGVGAFKALRTQITGTNMAFQLQQLQLQTISGQWKILKSVVEESQHSFGAAAKGGVMQLLKALQYLFDALTKAGVFKSLGTLFGRMAGGLGTVATAFGNIAPQIGTAVDWIADKLGNFVDNIAAKFPDLIDNMGAWLANLPAMLSGAGTGVQSLWTRISGYVVQGVKWIGDALDWLGTKFTDLGAWLLNDMPIIVMDAVYGLKKIGLAMIDVGAAIQDALTAIVPMLYDTMRPIAGITAALAALEATSSSL
ncbi:unnamed protein product, partial [marine sediment metagenome]